MSFNTKNPAAPSGATGSEKSQCLAAGDAPENSKPFPSLQESAAEELRSEQRCSVYDQAEAAIKYLECLRAHVSADDLPGTRYSWQKFVIHAQLVRIGVHALLR